MATIVRLSDEQIEHLLGEADEIERGFKTVYAEVEDCHVPEDVLANFRRLHNRFTKNTQFLRRQRELAKAEK